MSGSSVPEAARAAAKVAWLRYNRALNEWHDGAPLPPEGSGIDAVLEAAAPFIVAAAVAEERGDSDANLAEAFNLGCREGSLTTMRALGVEVLSQRSANVTDAIDVQCVNPYLTPDAERFMDEFSRLVTENDRLTSAVAEERATTGRAVERLKMSHPMNGDGHNYALEKVTTLLIKVGGPGVAAAIADERAAIDREADEFRARLDAENERRRRAALASPGEET